MKFNQKTLGNRLILKPHIEKQTKSGIVIARDERSQAINTDQGQVVMMGPACWYDLPKAERPDLKPGDWVYYSHYGAKTLKPEDSEEFYIICNDVDILVGIDKETVNTEVYDG